jgi:protease I
MLLAPKAGEVRGMNHDEKADSFSVDLQISSANPDDFDAVLLPGGVMNADTLRMVPEAQHFVRRIDASDRPIAVICHAPWLVVSAGLVSGRTITSYYTLQDDIRNAGGRWLDIESCTDRNWTSSRSPSDLPAFNRAMIELFAQYRAAGRKAA